MGTLRMRIRHLWARASHDFLRVWSCAYERRSSTIWVNPTHKTTPSLAVISAMRSLDR